MDEYTVEPMDEYTVERRFRTLAERLTECATIDRCIDLLKDCPRVPYEPHESYAQRRERRFEDLAIAELTRAKLPPELSVTWNGRVVLQATGAYDGVPSKFFRVHCASGSWDVARYVAFRPWEEKIDLLSSAQKQIPKKELEDLQDRFGIGEKYI